MLPSKAIEVLRRYEINAPGRLVSLEEALSMPRPLVLKANTEEHKTEKGLVFTCLKTDGEIREAYERIADGYGVIAQPFLKGFELILGALIDPTFGKVVMVGAGGIYAEIFRDVSFRKPPLSRRDVEEMLSGLKVGKVLSGFRERKINRESVIKTILSFSRLVENEEFREIDINPLIVNEKGAFAVDVRWIP